MKILDCTLRDGGYYTNWEYDDKLVREIVHALEEANIDVIEIGYKSPLKGGKYRKCNDHFIQNVLGFKPKAKLAFMVDVKDFVFNGSLNYKIIKDVIKPSNESIFDMCRVACTIDTLDDAIKMVKFLNSNDYITTINLMRASLLDLETLKECVKKMNKSKADVLYLADSFGSLTADKLYNYIKVYKDFSEKQFGFHSHNNMGLAFPNSIMAIDMGLDYIDGTITGMGRGAGNVRLEQLLMCFGTSYNKLIDLIDRKFAKMKNDYGWGWNHNYMLTGLKEIHPTYCQILESKNLTDLQIQDILKGITKKDSFDMSEIKGKDKKKVSVVIPARYKSSRFPGKPIVKIDGIPMVIRVADIAKGAVGKENIYIATEDDRIAKVVDAYDYKVILTSDSCLTGTDRVAEAAMEIDSDIIINVQGDEPLLNPKDILEVIEKKKKYPDSIINCMSRLDSFQYIEDRNIPKVVYGDDNNLLYMSRSAIPGTKYANSNKGYRQVCIYAFNKNELEDYLEYGFKNGKSKLEWEEDIEILRFLEMGYSVKMVEVYGNTHAVDIPEDVKTVEGILNE